MSKASGAVAGLFGRIALLDIDRPVHRHAHPHAHLLFKVGGTDSWFRVGNRLYPLTDRTTVLVNSWETHDYPHRSSDPNSLVLALYVEPEWLSSVDNVFRSSLGRGLFPQACVEVPKGVRRLLHNTAEAVLDKTALSKDHEDLLAKLMCEVMIRFSSAQRSRPSRMVYSGFARDFRIRRAIEFMKQRVGEQYTMETVADKAALSRAHFFELFRSNTGMSPLVFRNALKMEACYHKLLHSNENLGRISAQLNFTALPHFTRFFRDHLGVTPSEFRRAVTSYAGTSRDDPKVKDA